MKELKFEYRDGKEFVSWVGNTDEAGSSSVSHLKESQPGFWKLCEAAYEAWKVETTKPDSAAAKQKKADEKQAAEKAAEDVAKEKAAEERQAAYDKAVRDRAAKGKKASEDEDEEDDAPWKASSVSAAADKTKGAKK